MAVDNEGNGSLPGESERIENNVNHISFILLILFLFVYEKKKLTRSHRYPIVILGNSGSSSDSIRSGLFRHPRRTLGLVLLLLLPLTIPRAPGAG